MSVEARPEYVPGDPILIRNIINQLKSQGVFDQFRKECISDVDTKPAYQNLCHRVDGQVSSYLSDVRWGPDLNKNQLRESIRKFVNECTFVESGIARIVDQLVNPRINTVLVPKVEDIVYQYIGIPPIERPPPNESSRIYIAENHNSPFEKFKPSNATQKRNYDIEPDWLSFNSEKFDDYNHGKKESSSFDVKIEPRDEAKEKNGNSKTDLRHLENDEDSRAYSTIDSDEENLLDDEDDEEPSPPFEPLIKGETDAESDYSSVQMPDSRDTPPDTDPDVERAAAAAASNDVCHEEDTTQSHLSDGCRAEADTNTDPFDDDGAPPAPAPLPPNQRMPVPKTPTIHYETSEESDDNAGCAKDQPTDPGRELLGDDTLDFSHVDKIAQKIADDHREPEKSGDDRLSPVREECDAPKSAVEVDSTVVGAKANDEKGEKHHREGEKERSSDVVGAKESKHRERKHSEHRRKERHKSDKRDGSRDHSESHRSSRDSSKSKSHSSSSRHRTSSDDKTRKSSDEKDALSPEDDAATRAKGKDEHRAAHRAHDERARNRDKDDRKHKSASSGDKHRRRSRSDERGKRSRHEGGDRSKEAKRGAADDDKSKAKKGDGGGADAKRSDGRSEAIKCDGAAKCDGGAEAKKNDESEAKKSGGGKSQCGSDEKKARADRHSSDRDSNGPSSSSSSNHAHRRSAFKSDKEKHGGDKARHASTISSSHKSKKNGGAKNTSSCPSAGERHAKDGGENSHHRSANHNEKRGSDGAITSACSVAADRREEKASVVDSSVVVEAGLAAVAIPDGVGLIPKATGEQQKTLKTIPAKRSLVEQNVKNRRISNVSLATSTISDCSSPKMADCNPSSTAMPAMAIKKPKIARNQMEFGKVVKLRKEYKEKMRLLQQQGKENANYASELCGHQSQNEEDDKRMRERLAAAASNALKETKVVSNGSTAGGKNGLQFKDIKISIARVDSNYTIVNGSCFVADANHNYDAYPNRSTEADRNWMPADVEESRRSPQHFKIVKPNGVNDEKLFKIKICRSVSPSSGKERTKCVRSSVCSADEAKPDEKSDTTYNRVSSNYDDIDDEEDQMEDVDDDDLLSKMNIEEIIGCRTDCTRISYDTADLSAGDNGPDASDGVREDGGADEVAGKGRLNGAEADRRLLTTDQNEEHVGTTEPGTTEPTPLPHSGADHPTDTRCDSVSSDQTDSGYVRYFEPPSPNNAFANFVDKMIQESELQQSLPNALSVELNYPQEYDAIFRRDLGATVRRTGSVVAGHDATTHDQRLEAKSGSEVTAKPPSSVDGGATSREPVLSSSTCGHVVAPTISTSDCSQAGGEECSVKSSHDWDAAVVVAAAAAECNDAGVAGKSAAASRRKTLGIKRKISNAAAGSSAKHLVRKESSGGRNQANSSDAGDPSSNKKCKIVLAVSLPVAQNSSFVNVTNSQKENHAAEVLLTDCLDNVTEELNENKRLNSSINNNVLDSSSYSVPAKSSKKTRKSDDLSLPEMVPKRTAYQNKCYYDSSDLYKPRPSFLASSRRSRALNPSSK